MVALSSFCMVACCRTLVRHLHLVASDIKDVLDTLIAGSGRKGEFFLAGGFQTAGILVGQLQKPHTVVVRLLFYTFGGKDCVYYLLGTGSDPLRPLAGTVAVPFQVLLMGSRHVFRNCTVLSLTAIKTVGRNPVMLVKNAMVLSVTLTSTLCFIY